MPQGREIFDSGHFVFFELLGLQEENSHVCGGVEVINVWRLSNAHLVFNSLHVRTKVRTNLKVFTRMRAGLENWTGSLVELTFDSQGHVSN